MTLVEMLPQVPMGSGGLGMSSLQPVSWLAAQGWTGRRICYRGNDANRCDVTHSHGQMEARAGDWTVGGEVWAEVRNSRCDGKEMGRR